MMTGMTQAGYRYSWMAVVIAIGGAVLVILLWLGMTAGYFSFDLSGTVAGITIGLALLLAWTARSHSRLKKGQRVRPLDYNSSGNLIIIVWMMTFAYGFVRIFVGDSFAAFLGLGVYFSFFPTSLSVDYHLERKTSSS